MKDLNINFTSEKIRSVQSVYIACKLLMERKYYTYGFIPATDHFFQNQKTIVFPDIEYSLYNNFWEAIREINLKKLPVDGKLIKFLSESIDHYYKKSELEEKRLDLIEFWNSIENEFIEFLNNNFPGLKDKEINLDLGIKLFGAPIDFEKPSCFAQNKCKGYAGIRFDMPVEKIILSVFSLLFSDYLKEKQIYRWREQKSILDFLTNTFIEVLGLDCSKILGTIESLEQLKVEKKLISNSREFINKNKIPIQHIFSKEKGKIMLFGACLNDGTYTKDEISILDEFLEKDNNILTYDEIADIVWAEKATERFSLSTISKRIERLRNKLFEDGLPKSEIIAVRGIGYYLKN
ncbi:hypothetical protein GF362_02380 [Candidatus Dojkabacteria bacterium]|nr:hypothetical protein [Candidatus Dojkabacteria bacterium]